MPNRLNLPGYTVLTEPETDAVHAAYDTLPDTCPDCGAVGRLHRWGKRDMTITDTPNFGKRSRFTVTRIRLKCMECGHTFMQPLPGIDDKRRMTARAVTYIAQRGLQHTYAYLAEEFDVDPKTIANIVTDRPALTDVFPHFAPHYLGIDEVKADGEFRCIFTDVGNRRIIDFLPNRRKATVKRWFRQLAHPERVQAVTIDMWKDYRDAVYDVFGKQMPVVADKYHVTSKADQAVERTRIRLNREGDPAMRRHMKRSREILTKNPKKLTVQEQFLLSGWLLNFPILKVARDAMQSFKRIYNLQSRYEAERALDEWIRTLPAEVEEPFRDLLSAIEGWRHEIMNYFDHRITNAFTEAMNKKVKSIAREGAGYDFITMRRRILEGYRPKPAKGYQVCTKCGRPHDAANPVLQKLLVPIYLAPAALEDGKPVMICMMCFRAHQNDRWDKGTVPTTNS